MGRVTKKRFTSAGMIGLWGLLVLHEAIAGQPLEKVSAVLSHTSNTSRPASSIQAPAGRLDLRPPSEFVAAGTGAVVGANESFGDAPRGRMMDTKFAPRSDIGTVAPASTTASGHIMSPLQNMAHNFQRQGLPLAKLFENKDSLVHLGLNPKGKPGLWILHKLH